MKRFVIADIHGNFKALKQCLEISKFDYDKDLLISLGDEVDGYPDSFLVVEELMKIKNIILCRGNHNEWFLNWVKTGSTPSIWFRQGGDATLRSYNFTVNMKHYNYLNSAVKYYRSKDNKFFVHGGYDINFNPLKQELNEYVWNRSLIYVAKNPERHTTKQLTNLFKFNEIFVGHTTTEHFNSKEPLNFSNLWMLDTGCGWQGRLTIMNVDTKEYYQSETGVKLYGTIQGR